jgi:hypothetical protein
MKKRRERFGGVLATQSSILAGGRAYAGEARCAGKARIKTLADRRATSFGRRCWSSDQLHEVSCLVYLRRHCSQIPLVSPSDRFSRPSPAEGHRPSCPTPTIPSKRSSLPSMRPRMASWLSLSGSCSTGKAPHPDSLLGFQDSGADSSIA